MLLYTNIVNFFYSLSWVNAWVLTSVFCFFCFFLYLVFSFFFVAAVDKPYTSKPLNLKWVSKTILNFFMWFFFFSFWFLFWLPHLLFPANWPLFPEFGLFWVDRLSIFSLFLLMFISVFILYCFSFFITHFSFKFTPEFCFILICSIFFCLCLTVCNDLLLLFFLLEAISYCTCILIAMDTSSNFSLEAAIKYFMSSAISSGLIFLGISWIYFVTNATNYSQVVLSLNVSNPEEQFALWWILFLPVSLVVFGFLIKLGAFPFNFWTPDIYEGSNSLVLLFMVVFIKTALFLCFLKLNYLVFFFWFLTLKHVYFLSAVASFIIGALGAIKQLSVKRFIAYSSLNQFAFLLLALSSPYYFEGDSLVAILFFLCFYVLNSLVLLSSVIFLESRETYLIRYTDRCSSPPAQITDFAGFGSSYHGIGIVLTVSLFSFMGIPIFAGFFSKFFILQIVASSGGYFGVIVALFSNCFSAYYYLGLVRLIWFIAPFWHTMAYWTFPERVDFVFHHKFLKFWGFFYVVFFLNVWCIFFLNFFFLPILRMVFV